VHVAMSRQLPEFYIERIVVMKVQQVRSSGSLDVLLNGIKLVLELM
jgi:spore maturation protein SpmB